MNSYDFGWTATHDFHWKFRIDENGMFSRRTICSLAMQRAVRAGLVGMVLTGWHWIWYAPFEPSFNVPLNPTVPSHVAIRFHFRFPTHKLLFVWDRIYC